MALDEPHGTSHHATHHNGMSPDAELGDVIVKNALRQFRHRVWRTPMKRLVLLALAGAALSMSGRAHAQTTSGSDAAPVAAKPTPQAVSTACVPGIQVVCPCLGGGQGVQVCNDDGSRFEPCRCASVRSDATAPSSTVPPAAPASTFERNSAAMMVIGIVTLGVGAVAAGIGTVLAVTAIDAKSTRYCASYSSNPPYDCSEYDSTASDDRTKMTVGGVLIGGGVSLLAGGTALTVLGAKKVPSSPQGRATTSVPSALIEIIPARLTVRF